MPNQVTSQAPFFFATPTIEIFTPRLGISRTTSVAVYIKFCGCAGRYVVTCGAKPVAGRDGARDWEVLPSTPIVNCAAEALLKRRSVSELVTIAALLAPPGGTPRLLTRVRTVMV